MAGVPKLMRQMTAGDDEVPASGTANKLVFDDSWEHEVTNGGASQRVVLLINFWHPGLPPEQRTLAMDHGGYEPV